jgi:hypothetical protein
VFASATNTASAEGELVIRRGENVTIAAQLLQNGTYGDPVPNQVIEFFDQTHNVLIDNNTTDGNGIASINWTIPLSYPLGPALINATFRGNELLFLSSSAQWVFLNILSSMQIIISHGIESYAPGDLIHFTAVLLDDTDTPISGSQLTAMCGGTILASSITNSSGVALFTIQCNSSWVTLGENTISIVYEEDLVNFYARAEESFTVQIQQIVTFIDIDNYANEALLGEILTAHVRLSGSEGGISGEIEVYLADAIFDTISTNSVGNATLFLNIDSRFMPGMHTFYMIYNGSERYTSSFITAKLYVMSPALLRIEVPETPIVGIDANFSISVLDYFGRPFEGTLITLSDNTNGFNTTLQVFYSPPTSYILFPIVSSAGIHSIYVKLTNPFITNDTLYFPFVVWSKPALELQESNVVHYASLGQEILLKIRLTDWNGNCSFRNLQIILNGLTTMTESTDTDGIASLKIIAPHLEGMLNISIVYLGNTTLYETSAKYDYPLIISCLIPVQLEMYYFEVFPPLQEVTIHLGVRCLNGSMLAGIQVEFIWLSHEVRITSQQGGALMLHLPVPSERGNYLLHYEVNSSNGLAYSSDSIEISILLEDIVASQGIGIGGFAASIIISLATITIPVIRRRYLTR